MVVGFHLRWARRFRPQLLVIGGLSLASSGASLAVPWLIARFAGGVVGETSIDLGQTLGLLAAALIALMVLTILVTIASATADGNILAALRHDIYAHVQSLPISFHHQHRNGDLLGMMTSDASNLSTFLTGTIAQIPAMIVTAVGAVVLLFLIDPVMALIVPVLVPLFYIGMKLLGRRLRIIGRRLRKAEIEVLTLADSDLEMIPAIKSFAVEDQHRARYLDAIETARTLKLTQVRITSAIGPFVALTAAMAAIAILVFGNSAIEAGNRSPSELFAFLLYAALLTRPVGSLTDTYGRYQLARGSLARIEAVLAVPSEAGYALCETRERARGAICFEAVDFAYPGRPMVLEKFDLSISPGEIVALTGANGVGKTTLINLLLRFYEPASGHIRLDGTDIASINVKQLRSQFGYVPQRALLLNGSIIENIAFGIEDPDPDAIERAARLAQASDFICQLPQGLQTMIGDDGVRLSGGQRQRIALARALFRDPPIYIFDEATSMYDLEGEAAFVESCIQSLASRTVIIITHRPASLALADRIIELTPSGPVEAEGCDKDRGRAH